MATNDFTRLNLDRLDQLHRKSAQLSSLLTQATDEGFDYLAPEHRQNLLWLASDLSNDINNLLRAA